MPESTAGWSRDETAGHSHLESESGGSASDAGVRILEHFRGSNDHSSQQAQGWIAARLQAMSPAAIIGVGLVLICAVSAIFSAAAAYLKENWHDVRMLPWALTRFIYRQCHYSRLPGGFARTQGPCVIRHMQLCRQAWLHHTS